MGKLSRTDWQEMAGRYAPSGLMRQLDAGSGYREPNRADLAKRMSRQRQKRRTHRVSRGRSLLYGLHDSQRSHARFCKTCGNKL